MRQREGSDTLGVKAKKAIKQRYRVYSCANERKSDPNDYLAGAFDSYYDALVCIGKQAKGNRTFIFDAVTKTYMDPQEEYSGAIAATALAVLRENIGKTAIIVK